MLDNSIINQNVILYLFTKVVLDFHGSMETRAFTGMASQSFVSYRIVYMFSRGVCIEALGPKSMVMVITLIFRVSGLCCLVVGSVGGPWSWEAFL